MIFFVGSSFKCCVMARCCETYMPKKPRFCMMRNYNGQPYLSMKKKHKVIIDALVKKSSYF